jgi:hypothetical protein
MDHLFLVLVPRAVFLGCLYGCQGDLVYLLGKPPAKGAPSHGNDDAPKVEARSPSLELLVPTPGAEQHPVIRRRRTIHTDLLRYSPHLAMAVSDCEHVQPQEGCEDCKHAARPASRRETR